MIILGPLHSCQIKKDCNTRAKCVKGKCFCGEGSTGNGKYCRGIYYVVIQIVGLSIHYSGGV